MLDRINFISCKLVSAALVHFYVKGTSPTQLECVLGKSYLSYRSKTKLFFSNTRR